MNRTRPTRVVTTAEMRRLDALTSSEFGVPSRVLMENAGAAVAREALVLLEPGRKVLVLVGLGNNGGDGFVAARHLANRGVSVEVLSVAELLGKPLSGDAEANREAFQLLGGTSRPYASFSVQPGDVVIDALLGIGLTRPPDGALREAIEAIRSARARGASVLAVDLPSGLDADTGRAPGAVVQADATVTFGYLKRGLALEPGASDAGRVVIAEIGIPRRAERTIEGSPVFLLRDDEIQAILPPRPVDAHKNRFGHVLLLAGSPGKTGAAALACLGALRGGAGLVTLAGRSEVVEAAQRHAPEIMGLTLPGTGPLAVSDLPALLEGCRDRTVLAAGPGLWRGGETGELLTHLARELTIPIVLDADALNAFAALEDRVARFRSFKAPILLTPHPGEMARLIGRSTAEVQEDRIGVAHRLAVETHTTVLLKGARTVIAGYSGATAINPTGNSGMATGGTGDVLTGLCAALLGRGMTSGNAACAAAYIHGLAGDRAADRRGATGLMASDLLEALGEIWTSWSV